MSRHHIPTDLKILLNYSFNLNYDGKLDTSGTSLSADLDYSLQKQW
jgi:hypothetical protein